MAGLADTYCAMTRDTSYRSAFNNQQALERINQLRDTKFSANVVDQFISASGSTQWEPWSSSTPARSRW